MRTNAKAPRRPPPCRGIVRRPNARCKWAPAALLLATIIIPPLRAADPPAEAGRDSAAGPVRFTAPRGWARLAEPDRDVRIFSAPTARAEDVVTLVVSVGAVSNPDDFNFRERFDDFVALSLKGVEPRKRGTPRAGKTAQALPTLTQEVVADNGVDRQTYGKFVAIDLNDRLVGFSLTASSEKLYKETLREFDRLVASSVVTQAGGAAENRKRPLPAD